MRIHSGFRTALALCLSMACGILAGCGGGSSSSTNTATGGTGAAAKAPDFDFKSATGGEGINYIAAGGKHSFTLVLSSVNGMPSPVTLSATVPSGWTAAFTPNNVALPVGDTTVTMTVTAAANAAPASTQNVVYKAVGGGLTRYYSPGNFNPSISSRWLFQVNGIAFTVPASLTLGSQTGSFASTFPTGAGASGTGVTVIDAGSFGTVTPQVNGLPAGVTAVFDTPTASIGGDATRIDFTAIATGSPAAGTYPITVSFPFSGATYTSPPISLVVSSTASASNHLVVSGSTANTTVLKNGAFAGPLRGKTYTENVTFSGVAYNGEDFGAIGLSNSSKLNLILFGLPITSGQVFDFSQANNQNVIYLEDPLLYYAATGTLTVNSITATTMTVTFSNATFQAISTNNGNSTGATGSFTLNGTVTYPLNLAN
jgi:hypothetical protein